MTQQQLADISGISRVAIARYETNKQTPKMSALQKLAQALGVSVEELSATTQPTPEPTTEKTQEDTSITNTHTVKLSVNKAAYNKAIEYAKAEQRNNIIKSLLEDKDFQADIMAVVAKHIAQAFNEQSSSDLLSIRGKVIENINSANTDISPKHLAQKLNDPYTTHIQPFIQVIDDDDQNTKK